MSRRALSSAALATLCALAACSMPTSPSATPSGSRPAFEGGGGSEIIGGGGGGTTTGPCVENGAVDALVYLKSGPWTAVDSLGGVTTFTFDRNGSFERTRVTSDGRTVRVARGTWIQPFLGTYQDTRAYLTGTAASTSHCKFTWPTAQEGTILMTRQ